MKRSPYVLLVETSKNFSLFLIFRGAFVLFSASVWFCCCSTVTPALSPCVDYTDGRSVAREVHDVRALIAEKPLEALLRSYRLTVYTETNDEISGLYQDTRIAVEKRFFAAVEDGAWKRALVFFRSLSVLGHTVEQWSEQKLLAAAQNTWKEKKYTALLQYDAYEADNGDQAPSLATVRKMMKGVVTVWVDRGITIEKGLGKADRMIGSGFFIDENGYLITNYHVIQSEVDPAYEGYSRVYIKLAENPTVRIPAKVIGWDTVFDLALLKTEITPEVYFQFGSSKDLDTGSRIYAIGSPAGLEQTLTSGIVSAQNRRLLSLGSVLQIDAPINHGNSGGPIIDEAGRVQAVVFAGLERNEGLNFAIPIELLRLILPDLYAGGEIVHAWMSCYGVSEKGASAETRGIKLAYTVPGSSASTIPTDTVITHINGQRVSDLEALQSVLMRLSAGTIVKVSGYTPPVKMHHPVGQATADEQGTARMNGFAGTSGSADVLQADMLQNEVQKDWFVQLEGRPKMPAELIYRKDSRARALLPLYGISVESAGGRNSFRIADVILGSYADEAGFSRGDYLEIHKMKVRKDVEAVYTQIYTKRRKSAYIDTFMDIWAYLDNSSYF